MAWLLRHVDNSRDAVCLVEHVPVALIEDRVTEWRCLADGVRIPQPQPVDNIGRIVYNVEDIQAVTNVAQGVVTIRLVEQTAIDGVESTKVFWDDNLESAVLNWSIQCGYVDEVVHNFVATVDVWLDRRHGALEGCWLELGIGGQTTNQKISAFVYSGWQIL